MTDIGVEQLESRLEARPPDPRSDERLGRVLHGGGLDGLRAISDLAACLVPMLTALGWSGHSRHLSEALPHFADSLDIDGFRNILANLNYTSRSSPLRLRDLDPRLAPCAFVSDEGAAFVILRREGDMVTVFDGQTSTIARISVLGLQGTAYFFAQAEESQQQGAANTAQANWFDDVARRFRSLVLQMLGITFVTSMLALAVPIFIMTVYDRVISARSEEMLIYLTGGVVFALAVDFLLRVLRSRMLAYVGGRIDMILGAAAFQQIIHLPIMMTERATIGAQVSRLRQFESVREFFTGPMAGIFLELPFVAIFILVIAVIAGPLAWVPLILILAFALIAALTTPSMRRAVAEAGEARAKRQAFLIEMLGHLRSVKTCAGEGIWSRRYAPLSARSSLASFRTTQISVFVQTTAQILMMVSGIATIGIGTLRVLDGEMTIGALVAVMALVWRVLTPLQVAFLSLTRLEQVKLGLRQINQLMKLRLDREPGRVVQRHRTFTGEISFQRVSLRYSPNAEPALLGVDLAVRPGEIIAVSGPSSSGKSSLLKVIAGLYQPQAGAVLIDGIDIRQLDMGELRSSVAYLPQVSQFFHGTIAQNLRLANPTASDADLAQAVLDADLLDDILTLPEGFETRLTERFQRQLPTGFRQRLVLARGYVKDAPIYLMDEPAANLDEQGDAALRRKLQQLRGRATVFLVTHRPSHMRLADRLVYMQGGRVLAAGTPDEILPKLQMG
ncbi:MAG: ATP-binding cassette domain-containing protein [Kiloniellales bacterium]|nr:ATP-binding cassette domain-containing protein [Kiloniellales bacterium]